MELILIIFFSFLLRFIFLINDTSNWSDDSVHLWNIRTRKKIGNLWGHNVADISVFRGKRGYPPLGSYIISLFPKKYWGKVGRFLNIFYDCLLIIFCYLLSVYFLDLNSLGSGFSVPGLLTLIIATSPVLLPLTSRMTSLGTRSLGLLFSFTYFISLGFLMYTPNNTVQIMGGAICVLMGILIILSSQFALQTLIIFSLSISVIYLSTIPLIILGSIFLIAFLLPQLGFHDILAFKLEHYKWYIKNQQSGTTSTGRNKLSDHLKLPIYFWSDINKFCKIVFRKSSYIIAIYSLPPLIISIGLIVYFCPVNYIFSLPILEYSCAIIIASGVAFLITSLPPFLFLGQAERYFEYSIPFIAYVFIELVSHLNLSAKWVYYLILLQTIIILTHYLRINKSSIQNIFCHNEEVKDIIIYLKKCEPKKILTLPTKISFLFSFSLMPQHKFYFRCINKTGEGFNYMNKDWVKFEWPIPPLSSFKKKYGIDTIIVLKSKTKNVQSNTDINYNLNKLEKSYENETFSIYEL